MNAHRWKQPRLIAASFAAVLVLVLMTIRGDARAQDATTVMIADAGSLGLILTDSAGLTLYIFDRDTPGVSNCSGGCATTWPPLLLAEGDPIAPPDLPGTLAVITRADGGRQVTYNDQPLYLYVRDQQPGDTTGEGVGGVWHLARP
jgi:predicted lipoprotein with Yx(FWY)xxD motif